jgi:hypothetical protein
MTAVTTTITIYKASALTNCEGCGKKQVKCHFVRNDRFDVTDKLCVPCVAYQIKQASITGDTVDDQRRQ